MKKLRPPIDPVGKDMAQAGKLHSHLLQQWYRAMAVLDVGRVNMNPEKQAIGIGHNVPFAAVDTLSRVIAARPARWRGRCTLAVDHGGCRPWRASQLFSCPPDKNADDPLPPTRVSPCVKITLYRRIGRELLRQRPPLAARRQDVRTASTTLRRSVCGDGRVARSRQKRLDQPPFCFRHITCVTQSVTPILLPSDFSPGHHDLLQIFKTDGITQLRSLTLFSQAHEKGAGADALAPFVNDDCVKFYFAIYLSAYFVTWPRISPPGLAAVWMLT